MRQLVVAVAVVIAAGLGSSAAFAENVEVKGIHLCCGSCQKAIKATLDKVEGVSGIACDRKARTVKFTATDADTAKKAFAALLKSGFYGKATCEGKALKAGKSGASKDKAAEVTVAGVHVCCPGCKKAIEKLFPGATVTCTGNGPQKTVTISGENLTPAGVLSVLHKGGLNGTVK